MKNFINKIFVPKTVYHSWVLRQTSSLFNECQRQTITRKSPKSITTYQRILILPPSDYQHLNGRLQFILEHKIG